MGNKYPSPYFRGLPEHGDLELQFVFVELECPIVFICTNADNEIFLCFCCDITKEQRWIVAPICLRDLFKMIANKLSFYDFYKSAKPIFKIVWEKGYESEKIYETSFSECINDVPTEGIYLDYDPDEFSDMGNLNVDEFELSHYDKIYRELGLDEEQYPEGYIPNDYMEKLQALRLRNERFWRRPGWTISDRTGDLCGVRI